MGRVTSLMAVVLAAAAVGAQAGVRDLGVTVPEPDAWSRSTLLATDAAGGVYACNGNTVYRLVGGGFVSLVSGLADVAGADIDPAGFAVAPDGSMAYVATGMSGLILEVDLAARSARELSGARLHLGMSGNYGMAADPVYGIPLVTNAWAQGLYQVSPAGNGALTLLDTFGASGQAGGAVAFTPQGELLAPVPTSRCRYPQDDVFTVDLYRFSRDWLDDLAGGTAATGAGVRYAVGLAVSGTGAAAADARGHLYLLAQDAVYHAGAEGGIRTLAGDPGRNIWSALFEGEEFMALAYDAAGRRLLFSRRTTWFDGYGQRQYSPWGLYACHLVIGDLSGDGVVDAADTGLRVQALAAPATYAAAHPDLDAALLGDLNGDLEFNVADLGVDLGDGSLVIPYGGEPASPVATVRDWVRSGFNSAAGGWWDGPGIASSAAAADPAYATAVGVLDNRHEFLGGRTEFDGRPVEADSILLKYTWWGDIDFDGQVTLTDYSVFLYYFFEQDHMTPDEMGWWSGDLDYDGRVTLTDYNLLLYGFLTQTGPWGGGAPTPVPEPATLALVGVGVAGALRRRAGRRSARRPRRGFTLVELLVVITIMGVLLGLLAPAVASVLEMAEQTTCASNLRQIGLATQMYLKDSGGWFFPLVTDTRSGRRWYFGLESVNSPQGEGRRTLDRTQGALYPYLTSAESVEVCPSVPFGSPYKPKFAGASWSFGVNYYLSNHKAVGNFAWIRPEDAGRTALFADAAQVNTWLAPASPGNPMVEDHYWIQPRMPYVQFRHGGKANVLFADWHVEPMGPAPGSLDPQLPRAMVGYFDDAEVLLKPNGPR